MAYTTKIIMAFKLVADLGDGSPIRVFVRTKRLATLVKEIAVFDFCVRDYVCVLFPLSHFSSVQDRKKDTPRRRAMQQNFRQNCPHCLHLSVSE